VSQGALFVTVHCMFCPHVEEGASPEEVHDQMERHYRGRHQREIDRAIGVVTKLTEGFALADRMLTVKGDDLADLLEQAANDADIALAVMTRLVTHARGETDEEMDAAAARAGIPPALQAQERRSAGGLLLP
jgi:hypothetical protein